MQFNIHVSVISIEHLKALNNSNIDYISRLYVDSSIVENAIDDLNKFKDIEIYISAPNIFRQDNIDFFINALKAYKFKGILIKNIEEFSFINLKYDLFNGYDIVLDNSMYILNDQAFKLLNATSKINISEIYNSFELNEKELSQLKNIEENVTFSNIVYGRIPMMISANCIKKTLQKCNHSSSFEKITDRYKNNMPVFCNCNYCYNVIYNSIPISLHKYVSRLINVGNIRMDFTTETNNELIKILDYFSILKNQYLDPPYKDYTTAHYKRGVE